MNRIDMKKYLGERLVLQLQASVLVIGRKTFMRKRKKKKRKPTKIVSSKTWQSPKEELPGKCKKMIWELQLEI